MANDTQDKKQGESDILAKLFFTAEGGGAKKAKSGEKSVIAPEVRLYFFRYGLFPYETGSFDTVRVTGSIYNEVTELPKLKDSKKETDKNKKKEEAPTILNDVEILKLKEVPKLENFYIARTALNPGYIYIMNDDDADNYFELQINEIGQIQHINWQYSKNKNSNGEVLDIRIPDGDKNDFKIIYPNKDGSAKKIRIAYSPVQWSRAYHNELNTNKDKREKRMKLIDCSGIKKGQESSDPKVCYYKDVNAVYPISHSCATALKKALDQIHIDEEEQDEKEIENPDEKNLFYEDMFVTLHDPMGAAHDINNQVSEKILLHKALIEAIHSGESHQGAFQRLARGDFNAPAPKPEYQAMFSLALTSYHYVYNSNESTRSYNGNEEGSINDLRSVHYEDDEMITKTLTSGGYDGLMAVSYTDPTYQVPNSQFWGTGRGTNPDKIIGILGKKVRETSREIAMSYRNDLGNLLSSDYMKEKGYLDDFLGNIDDRVLDGRCDHLDLMSNLILNPIEFEKTLILKRHHKGPDKWTKWAYRVSDPDNIEEYKNGSITSQVSGYENLDPFFAVIAVTINVSKVVDKSSSTGLKLFKAFRSILKQLAGQNIIVKEAHAKTIQVSEKQRFIY
ncbi:toxin VasX [Cellulophaga algicola]|nr:toxin VasX [Cellulophaga algicola]